MRLEDFNPWWKTKKVPETFIGIRREIFYKIARYVETRQILILTGMRRVGKTTLMYQLIDDLLKNGVDPYRILYFSFDEAQFEIEEILKYYEINILQKELYDQHVYVFLDEIQKFPGWNTRIKLIYDRYPNMKLLLTGSGQITLLKGAGESLAGRFFNFPIKPLDFEEYLKFKGIEIDKKREVLFEKELKWHILQFMKTGGFIEALNMDEFLLRKYFKESLIERVVFIDIVKTFKVEFPEVLLKILNIAASFPGFYLEYKNLSNDLKIDQRTLANYISYLEYALFIQKLFNFSVNYLTSEKKLKRIYISNTGFSFALNPEIHLPYAIEQWMINTLEAKFFYRSPQKEEVDIIYQGSKATIPIEINVKNKVTREDMKALLKFLRKNRLSVGLLITMDLETTFEDGGITIEAVPYWKYWTLNSLIQELSSG